MIYRIAILLFLSTFCQAQKLDKTVVFKVRSQATQCKIVCKNSFFTLEMNNPVEIKLKGRNKNVLVVVSAGGKIMSTEGDTYYIRFVRPGSAVITVYQYTSEGRRLLATKMQEVRAPDIFFCGIKMDSSSRFIKFKGTNFYAYSNYYKQMMPMASFDMYYAEDSLDLRTQKVVMGSAIKMKSDTCMLSPIMRERLLKFQPKKNYIYFSNIICIVPDGSKRILDPIELNVVTDTANKEVFSLKYSVRKKKE